MHVIDLRRGIYPGWTRDQAEKGPPYGSSMSDRDERHVPAGLFRPANKNSISPIAARTYFHVLMPRTLGTATVNAATIAVTAPTRRVRADPAALFIRS